MAENILVTGATGTVGSEVVKALLRKKQTVTVGVRSPDKLKPCVWASNVSIVQLDYDKPETIKDALTGVTKLFIVTPSGQLIEKVVVSEILNAADPAKLKHIIRLSGMGAENHNIFGWHHEADNLLLDSEIDATILRPNYFMQNLYKYLASIREQHKIIEPVHDGKISFIDVRDIAEIVAEIFTHVGHENKTYDLTGAEALSYEQIATMLTTALGVTITYEPQTKDEYLASNIQSGMTQDLAAKFQELSERVVAGEYSPVSTNARDILGHEPISMRQFIQDHKTKLLNEEQI